MRNGKAPAAYEYLRDVQSLAVTIGKYNKPLFVSMNGVALNSAASIFASVPLALADRKTL